MGQTEVRHSVVSFATPVVPNLVGVAGSLTQCEARHEYQWRQLQRVTLEEHVVPIPSSGAVQSSHHF